MGATRELSRVGVPRSSIRFRDRQWRLPLDCDPSRHRVSLPGRTTAGNAMRHELFGDMTYERDEGAWSVTLPLSRLVAFGRRTEAADGPTVEEMIADISEGSTSLWSG